MPEYWAYHTLIIGINDYAKWPRLQTAVKDATVIKETLISRYGFKPDNVILRTDRQASRLQIIADLRYLAQSMGEHDNLFVYYAGHGLQVAHGSARDGAGPSVVERQDLGGVGDQQGEVVAGAPSGLVHDLLNDGFRSEAVILPHTPLLAARA